jgi:hypothetical protein
MVIEPKHVGAILMQILIFFYSNSFVHQLVNKTLILLLMWLKFEGRIVMHP